MTAVEPGLAGPVYDEAAVDRTPPALSAPSVTRLVVDVDGIPMSVLLSEAEQPRGVIVALHGGAAISAYFDDPGRPRHSLLRLGTALGFTVIAVDRPGYGDSASHAADLTSAERRVDLVYAVVDRLLETRPQGAGVFLLGHSIGCELVLRMAGRPRGTDLLGVELAGTGRHHHPGIQELLQGRREAAAVPKSQGRALFDLLWTPSRLYPSEVIGGAGFASPTPGYEGEVAQTWKEEFAELAGAVRVPVHYTLSDHEQVWRTGPAALADIASLFTAAPRVCTDEFAESGHNLSVGLTAMAYHLRALSFVEECVLDRLTTRRAG
ncbi:alpha/beta hydrolase [Catenulispora rubra]|uniref:alpha/beta hydrolase n=1 Tax=Catenulispora rubra TaxID=280293 RepID=UPI0018922C84|nr:alpha/beta fold hydrolase [Catenulispora rubra]